MSTTLEKLMLILESLDRIGYEYTAVRGGNQMRQRPPMSKQSSLSSGGFVSTSAGDDADAISLLCSDSLTEQQRKDMMHDLRDKP
jgi:hypothetical protein